MTCGVGLRLLCPCTISRRDPAAVLIPFLPGTSLQARLRTTPLGLITMYPGAAHREFSVGLTVGSQLLCPLPGHQGGVFHNNVGGRRAL